LKLSRDPEAEAILQKVWANLGVQPRDLSNEEIVNICYLPVVNEGFKCLEEGMASKASDIDVCCVFGYNWPRYHGGPMQWATAVGLAKVVETLESMKIEPAALLKECVKNDWTIHSKEFAERVEQTWSAKWRASKL